MLAHSYLLSLIDLARSESVDELLDRALTVLEQGLKLAGRIELFARDGLRIGRGALRTENVAHRTWVGNRHTIGAIYLDVVPPDPFGLELLAVQLTPVAEHLLGCEASERWTLREEIEHVYERRIRDALIRSDWNASVVAKDLCVGRGRVGRVVRRWRMR